jgi:hypothetical protein
MRFVSIILLVQLKSFSFAASNDTIVAAHDDDDVLSGRRYASALLA